MEGDRRWLTDMTDRYREVCAQFAPAFAELHRAAGEGVACRPTNTRVRRVYLFADRESADAFLRSALFRTVGSYPQFTDLALRRFDIDETRRAAPSPASPSSRMTLR
jgi:hypothetical protein